MDDYIYLQSLEGKCCLIPSTVHCGSQGFLCVSDNVLAQSQEPCGHRCDDGRSFELARLLEDLVVNLHLSHLFLFSSSASSFLLLSYACLALYVIP